MKKNNIQELLDVEIYQKNDFYYLEVPVQNIIQPKFLLKDNTLYLFYTGHVVLDKENDKDDDEDALLNIFRDIKNLNC